MGELLRIAAAAAAVVVVVAAEEEAYPAVGASVDLVTYGPFGWTTESSAREREWGTVNMIL